MPDPIGRAASEACDGGRRRGQFVSERVNLARARDLLAEQGDIVGQSSLSRYVAKYADDLHPERDGRELTVDFERLAQHRRENISPPASAPSSSPASVSVSKGRAHEASLNIRAQRQMRELEIAERIGALTSTREVRAAAAEAMSALRNAFALSLNDSAAALAHAFNIEPRLVRPYLKAFEKGGLDAFARALVVAELEPDADA
jgi:hypothetical protein